MPCRVLHTAVVHRDSLGKVDYVVCRHGVIPVLRSGELPVGEEAVISESYPSRSTEQPGIRAAPEMPVAVDSVVGQRDIIIYHDGTAQGIAAVL